jgi:hypothetical protein
MPISTNAITCFLCSADYDDHPMVGPPQTSPPTVKNDYNLSPTQPLKKPPPVLLVSISCLHYFVVNITVEKIECMFLNDLE